MLSLLPSFVEFVHDSWWEVQAQLLRLAAQLLRFLGARSWARREGGSRDQDGSPMEGDDPDDGAVETLLLIVQRVFGVASTSKIVLQVGLCSLVHILGFYPSVLPSYVAVLLSQPAGLRQRLLTGPAKADDGTAPPPRSLAYVMGTSSRLYEECCVCDHWPALDIARTMAGQAEVAQLPHFEPEHLEVLSGCLPSQDIDIDDAWLGVFEKVKAYVFLAIVDPALHHQAMEVVRRFWLCRPQVSALRAVDASKKTVVQMLRIAYSNTPQTRVAESDLLFFLREMRDTGGAIANMLQAAVDQFREAHNSEFLRSSLDTLFE